MKKFLIADDHSIVRTGLKFLIREEFMDAEIDECQDGNSAWKKIQTGEYDLTILDISMPATDFLHLLKNVFDLKPDLKILIVTMSSERIYAKKYLNLSPSVKGFINKEAAPSEIRRAIVSILNNKKYLSPRLLDIQIQEILKGKEKNPFDALSIRELEIMNHLVSGKDIPEIAGILSVDSSIIRIHKANIMHKLGVSNVIELCEMVQRF
ncbi:two component transcriptional regulator, LuxR family [Chitinophaga sp. CF118]|uniref:response regulator n=1 Tax=Chitinophaga sp. CF118 TaxID=1884367 RepID=UPI0008E8ACDE|nr:response regulator transcription factor [Chitinophaga sp. CF118]SFE51820.1 two component transcriptional regulator, LuxR family [Chitinophaga sp. CF118]